MTTDPTPPYEQLRRQLVDLIQSGVLVSGDRLPPLRQLASDLGLAVGTVARTYRELESAGLVASRRGGGTRVQRGIAGRSQAQRRKALRELAGSYLQQARLLGFDDEDIVTALTDANTAATGEAHTQTAKVQRCSKST